MEKKLGQKIVEKKHCGKDRLLEKFEGYLICGNTLLMAKIFSQRVKDAARSQNGDRKHYLEIVFVVQNHQTSGKLRPSNIQEMDEIGMTTMGHPASNTGNRASKSIANQGIPDFR